MQENKAKFPQIAISELKPYEKNARTHSTAQIDAICNSINEFGFINPVIIDENNMILVGHGRVEAAKVIGIEKAPYRRITNLTEDQKRAYILADNKLSDLGGWDSGILADELANIELDMSLFGFEPLEIDIPEMEPDITEDETPAVDDETEPTAQIGDIYRLGDHVLMCADSTDKKNFDKLVSFATDPVQLILTDPPYNFSYSGGGFMNERRKRLKEKLKDIIDFDPHTISYLAALDNLSMYIFTSKDLLFDYMQIFKAWNFNLLIWKKTNPPPAVNNTFLPDIEYILYFYKGTRVWNNNMQLNEYSKFFISSIEQGAKDAGGKVHPTIKPLELLINKIKINSTPGGYVMDLFGGSGSTLIACERTGRKCLMLEYEPKYIDVIIQRYENATGNKAVKIE